MMSIPARSMSRIANIVPSSCACSSRSPGMRQMSRSEAVGVAFAPDFAIGDDVDPGALHVTDCQYRSVVLRLFQQVAWNAPDVLRMRARHAMLLQHCSIHQPVR